MDGQGTRMHLALLRAEVAAARIEALTLAEPEVGRLWRTEAAFAEASGRWRSRTCGCRNPRS